jgi:hypothetical protein
VIALTRSFHRKGASLLLGWACMHANMHLGKQSTAVMFVAMLVKDGHSHVND